LVWPWVPACNNVFGLEDDFTELDFVLVVGFRRSFSRLSSASLFFADCLLLLFRAATPTALVVIVVLVDIALLS
jgi:hypothetical protein